VLYRDVASIRSGVRQVTNRCGSEVVDCDWRAWTSNHVTPTGGVRKTKALSAGLAPRRSRTSDR